MVTTRLGRRKYGPSRTRWLLIGLIIGLILGLTMGNPDISLLDLANPSTYIEMLPVGGG